jgi:hypothetical protein
MQSLFEEFFNKIQVTCVGARVMGFAKTRATMP